MEDYNQIDQRLHLLSQPIAKANRTYIAKHEDDSHTNIYFDPIAKRLLGRWINTKEGRMIFSFNLNNQHFEWLDDTFTVLQHIDSVGRNIYELEQEIERGLPDVGLNPKGFTEKLHFEIPAYKIHNELFENFASADLVKWIDYRELANSACLALPGYLQADGEVRIWPHHFDTGIYVAPNKKTGIGFGLAMEDTMAESPYFYLSGYALEGEITYKNLPQLKKGEWIIGENWNGAILPITDLDKLAKNERIPATLSFIKNSTEYFLRN